jgi:hypothetical protein
MALAFMSSHILFLCAPISLFSVGVGFSGSLREFIAEETTYRLHWEGFTWLREGFMALR